MYNESMKTLIIIAFAQSLAFFACKDSSESSRTPAAGGGGAIGGAGATPTPIPGATTQPGSGAALRVVFTGSKGDSVPANIYVPTNAAPGQKFAGMLLEPGIGGDKDSSYIKQLAELLNPLGMIVLTIDPPGAGERKNPNQSKTDFFLTGLSSDLFSQYIGDYKLAISFLLARPDVDPTRIVYAGASLGAITGIPMVAQDLRVKALVSIVGGGGFFGLVPVDLDPANCIARVEPRPALLVNATNDQVILKPFSDALQNAAGPSAKKMWLNTNHTLDGIPQSQLVQIFLDFLKQSHMLP